MADVSPVDLQKALSGVDYPTGRQELVEHAQRRGADDSVVGVLESLPDREYDGPNAVSEEAFNRR
jgi:hypothetical protein